MTQRVPFGTAQAASLEPAGTVKSGGKSSRYGRAGRRFGKTAHSGAAPFRNRAGQVRLPIRRPAGIRFSAAD